MVSDYWKWWGENKEYCQNTGIPKNPDQYYKKRRRNNEESHHRRK